MKNNTISIAIAVYNEEDYLRNCLESVRGLADEIVIVDGGSSDNTIKIAKEFNAKILQTDNPPNFHVNKNKAIDAVSGDWILQLDADEIVIRPLAMEIKTAIAKKSDTNGYWIPRKNFFLGRYLTKGGQYPDYTLRLYKRGKGRLPAKDVHEQAVVSGKTGYLKNDLLHLRDKEFSIYLKRFNRYTDLLAYQLKKSDIGINIFSFFNFVVVKFVGWFLDSYVKHRGYVDGFPGFIFAFFSSLRFPVAYLKLWNIHESRN